MVKQILKLMDAEILFFRRSVVSKLFLLRLFIGQSTFPRFMVGQLCTELDFSNLQEFDYLFFQSRSLIF